MAKSGKGSAFERLICTKLSLWWSGNTRDDIFWRTSGSGARAKTRGRKNKTTSGQDSDIAAIDPDGVPLTSLICIELKKGYNKSTITDLLDKPNANVKQVYEEFFDQVLESREQGKLPYWMVIHKRDRREALCIFPDYLLYHLEKEGAKELDKCNRLEIKINFVGKGVKLYALKLNDFLKNVKREHIINLYNSNKK